MPAGEQVESMTLEGAFQAAVAEHSKPEQADAAEKAVESKPVDDTKAAEETPQVLEPETAGAPDETVEQLLSDEDFEKLKGDPAKLRKELQAAFTRKTQSLAEVRRDLESKKRLLDELENEPEETVRALAKQLGIDLGKVAGPTPAEVAPADSPFVKILKTHLGPELEGLADRLAPAITEIAQSIAAKEVQPMRVAELQREVQSDLAAFNKDHPDWKTYEKEIVSLSYKILPGEKMGPSEYLGTLYKLATSDKKVAETVKKTTERIARSVAASELSDSGAATGTIQSSLPKSPTLEEAFQMAIRGQLVED